MFNPVDKTTFDVRKSSISVPTVFLVVWFLSDNHCFCQQRVINKWCMTFLILFEEGLRNLRDAQIVSRGTPDNWVPIGGDVVERNVARKTARERRKLEGLDLGMQELRTYFRLFMLSTFLLMFMFCTRISKNRNRDSGNVFDPWMPRKRWLELAAQMSFSSKSDGHLLPQMNKARETFDVGTQFCALPFGVGEEAARIRMVIRQFLFRF